MSKAIRVGILGRGSCGAEEKGGRPGKMLTRRKERSPAG
jgi:hypothetical protein